MGVVLKYYLSLYFVKGIILYMKSRISAIMLAAFVMFMSASGEAFARSSARAGSASEFQKALDSGATDITITSSFRGNFVIPRWVYSISGTGQNITISPADESKPVFDAESSTKKNLVRAAELAFAWPIALIHGAVAESTSDTLKFSDLTVICAGRTAAIDTDSISKPVTISNVKFKGVRKKTSGNDIFMGCKPSTTTTFTGCTFEDLTWGVYAVDVAAGYALTIRNCTFKDVSQALAMNDTSSGARASIENCKGENVGYWVFQHGTGSSIMYVTVDQATIDSYYGSDYYHRAVEALDSNNAYSSTQFQTFGEDLERTFKALPEGARRRIIKEQSRSWDDIRIYAMSELNRKLRSIDFSKDSRKDIEECVELYALLASAPSARLFSYDGSIANFQLLAMLNEAISGMVSDKNLTMPILRGFIDSTELAPLTKTGARISWGNTGNVREVLSRISQNPDRIFRENLHRLQDWLAALEDARKNLQELKSMAGRNYDYSYVAEMEKTLRAVYDFGIAANRFSAAIFFDLPVDVAFSVNFAKVSAESNTSRIMGICRELGSFYSVSQRLCVLNRTQTLRNELLKLWKEKLTEGWISKDHSKYDELLTSLGTDPDLMRDATRVNDFFREWR